MYVWSINPQLMVLKEMLRIIKPGGSIFVTAWSLEHNGRGFEEQDAYVPWKMPKRYHGKNFSEKGNKDAVFLRYYHLFQEGELEQLVRKTAIENIEVVDSGLEGQNWFIEVRKCVAVDDEKDQA